MRRVIIDCDPGIDDTLALMLALASPELEVVAITTVAGNVPAKMGAQNARKVLHMMERMDIPVYIGEEAPLKIPYQDAMDTHGADGMGEINLANVPGEFPKQGAVAYLEELLERENVSVIALGPLTNLARVFEKKPHLAKKIDEMVCMGGTFKSHGNCSPVAEYNFWCDPHGAALCFETFEQVGKQIHMIGLDVTRKIVLSLDLTELMCRINPQIGGFIRDMTRFYVDFHWEQEGIIGCVINDPLAVAYFIDRSLCGGFDSYTQVATDGICRGQSVVDAEHFYRKPANSHILTTTDSEKFWLFFMERVLLKTDSKPE